MDTTTDTPTQRIAEAYGVGTIYEVWTTDAGTYRVTVASGPAARTLGLYRTNAAALEFVGRQIDRELAAEFGEEA